MQRATTAERDPKQDTDPIILHTKFGEDSSYTFLAETMCDAGRRKVDAGKRKNNMSTPTRGQDC